MPTTLATVGATGRVRDNEEPESCCKGHLVSGASQLGMHISLPQPHAGAIIINEGLGGEALVFF